jgi:hypothetical protein
MAQQASQHAAPAPSAAMPAPMAEIKSQSVDKVLEEMNRMPLFMTNLDETDGEGGVNDALEALKALAYEGTRAEIAENFRQQGNDHARVKQWTDAKEFYDKAIAALKGPQNNPDPDAEGPKVIEVELDEAEEAAKEKATEEACYVNRALCNLEKSKSDLLRYIVPTYEDPSCAGAHSRVDGKIDRRTHSDVCRKLSLLHPGLCTNTPHQSLKRQGILPIWYSMFGSRQA